MPSTRLDLDSKTRGEHELRKWHFLIQQLQRAATESQKLFRRMPRRQKPDSSTLHPKTSFDPFSKVRHQSIRARSFLKQVN